MVSDVLALVQTVNAEALTGGVAREDALSRDIAYSMSCLFAELAKAIRSPKAHQDASAKPRLEWALEVLAHAWSQLLAGDIDDIVQDVKDSGLWESLEHVH